MDDHTDKREFTRIPIHHTVFLVGPDGNQIQGLTRVLSMNGLFVESSVILSLETVVSIRIELVSELSPTFIEATGRIANIKDDGMGIEFISLNGMESYQHLCNLVVLHGGDDQRVEDEISRHAGIRRRFHLGF